LKKEEKKYDHFIRACHEMEIPIIKKHAEADQLQRKSFWEQKEIERIENLKKEQQLHIENRERLLRMMDAKVAFEKIIHSARNEEFQKKHAEFEAKLVVAREAKLLERKEKRKQDRQAAYKKEIEDRKKQEEDDKRAKEDEERRRKQDEQARKQREREREIEEKLLAKEREVEQPPRDEKREGASSSGAYKPRAAGGSGFTSTQSRREPPRETPADSESSWRRPTGPPDNTAYRAPASRDVREDTGAYRGPANRDSDRRYQADSGDNWRKRGDANESRGGNESRSGNGESSNFYFLIFKILIKFQLNLRSRS
jgi:translation initiation factor 3 subunit A